MMAVSGTESVNLPLVRRLEAVGFRAWPAASAAYDGSWQVRLTGGHPSKRINCVVPLDPSDYKDAALRMERTGKRFADYGRELTFRETPLMAPPLVELLQDRGWKSFDESLVMSVSLVGLELPDTLDHLPTQDVGLFLDGCIALGEAGPESRAALAEIIGSIRPDRGMFVIAPEGEPLATALCVRDNDLAGIFSLAVSQEQRRSGLGTEILSAALRWARISGATTAWLQVTATNEAAIGLYRRFGFSTAYAYRYWRQGEAA